MAIDISKVFKANVKAIRMQLSDGSDKSEILNEQILNSKKTKTAANKSTENSFVKEAGQLVKNITILKDFLIENKKFYIQPNYLLAQSSGDDRQNQIDRQNFEDQAESIITKCANAIKQLKENAFRQIHTAQYKEHLENVFYLLEKYLEEVCKIYSGQKAIRFKRIIQEKNLSQLCSKEIEFLSQAKPSNKVERLEDEEKDSKSSERRHEEIEREENEKKAKAEAIENQLSEHELLSLEKENQMLYDNLTLQSEEVRKIESEVIEVSRLTEIFTQNIVSQMTSVESIQKAVFDTNSNLTTGNESIKEAMRKDAALRVWILFVLIVLSFTLLFLDWYND